MGRQAPGTTGLTFTANTLGRNGTGIIVTNLTESTISTAAADDDTDDDDITPRITPRTSARTGQCPARMPQGSRNGSHCPLPRRCSPAAGRKRGWIRRQYGAGNLFWTCRSGNVRSALALKRAGIGPAHNWLTPEAYADRSWCPRRRTPSPPRARSIDGAWTNVVRSFRSPAACPPGLDGIVHTGCIAANGLAVAVADELSSRSSPCSSIKLLVFRT